MGLEEVGCEGMDWLDLAQEMDRWKAFVNAVMNLRVPYNMGKLLTSWKTVRFSRRTLLHGVGIIPFTSFLASFFYSSVLTLFPALFPSLVFHAFRYPPLCSTRNSTVSTKLIYF